MYNPATIEAFQTTRLADLSGQILQAQSDLELAQLRAKSLQHPKTSYYESWFPINRPLRDITKIILLTVGIFFFCLSFLAILHAFGFIIHVNISWFNNENLDKLKRLFPVGSIILIVLLLILTIIGWLRKA